MDFGRGDMHGNQAGETTQSYFDHIMIDYTNAAFPLLPSGANDTTAPGAPPVVRDGTGAADVSIALSTTQLSANWDNAVDNESGIKGYQYAIGTSPGRHQTVELDDVHVSVGDNEDGIEPDHGPNLLFQREGHQRRGIDRPRHEFQRANRGHRRDGPRRPGCRQGCVWSMEFGPMPDIDENPSYPGLYGNWDPATDNESGISFYQYGIGTTPGATDFYGWTYASGNAEPRDLR